eukprot:TRINITY_DN118385_c0_g1_i1.p1 TRINITY_DN118385_c0_g1~~TRINITY_DN118385_c0_g1_i1.p1  ORF type:complete len:128 (+),score=4.97 TRINITY_DN118385_c0_g1_i1:184-567(+)
MLPELQGRLPIKVELLPLTREDFCQILREPQNNLIAQNLALLSTEGVELSFSESAVNEIAEVAVELNTHIENIGARRLHSVLEKVVSDISFNAPEVETGTKITITRDCVRSAVGDILSKNDLRRYLL